MRSLRVRAAAAALTLSVGCSLTTDPDGVPPPSETAAPRLALSSNALRFQAAIGGAGPAAQAVTVGNAGGGTLAPPAATVAYASGSGWLAATVSGTSAPYTLTLQPAAPAAAGEYAATVSVASAGAGDSPQAISVRYAVVPRALAGCAVATGGHAVCGGRLSSGGEAVVSAAGAHRIERSVVASGSAPAAPASSGHRIEGGVVSAGSAGFQPAVPGGVTP